MAIDETEIVNADGLVTLVRQPLPLPEGVSNYAVGFDMGVEGISVANSPAPKINLRPQVLEDLGGNLRELLECLIIEEMKDWEDHILKAFNGKELEVKVDGLSGQVFVSVNGKKVSEKHRKCLEIIIARLPDRFADNVTFHIQFPQIQFANVEVSSS